MSSYTSHSLPPTPSYLVARLTQKLGDSWWRKTARSRVTFTTSRDVHGQRFERRQGEPLTTSTTSRRQEREGGFSFSNGGRKEKRQQVRQQPSHIHHIVDPFGRRHITYSTRQFRPTTFHRDKYGRGRLAGSFPTIHKSTDSYQKMTLSPFFLYF